MTTEAGATLEHNGERMLPEMSAPQTFWEHIYRYQFATRYVRGRRTLDIACGEGYGTAALLAAGARSVVGVDICPEACAHARARYGVETRLGRAERIPLDDASVDVVVSFETVEHVEDPRRFIAECERVLSPGGMLVLSTPNRPVYSPNGRHNRYHRAEMDEEEFRSLLATRFTDYSLYCQSAVAVAWWSHRVLGAQPSWLSRSLPGRAALRGLRSLLCPRILDRNPAAERATPVQAVLRADTWAGALVNPFMVRKWVARYREEPTYWIAVALKAADPSKD
jgi:2-polyprenyl-3-methyl-5-hydroxy-6-metoxy-1,4-benzoquinol methylase